MFMQKDKPGNKKEKKENKSSMTEANDSLGEDERGYKTHK